MQINLTSIDTDKVMAKKRNPEPMECSCEKCISIRKGFNACVTHNDTLTIEMEMDAEKMIETISKIRHKQIAWVGKRYSNVNIVKSLLSNPAAWMKIGVKK